MQERTCSDAIKLFGKKICISVKASFPADTLHVLSLDDDAPDWQKPADKESAFLPPAEVIESPKTPSMEETISKASDSLPENEASDSPNLKEKPKLKKPDKIIPCPRCKSMDTKFCYYNNYNVNQPRHFCKACQRYWTAGGSMRNVPVGAGRRKNKNSASYYRYITISEALQSNGTNNHSMNTNGKVLNFGLEDPVCDSMDSVRKMVDKKDLKRSRETFQPTEEKHDLSSIEEGENIDDCPTSTEEGRTQPQDTYVQSVNSFTPSIKYQNIPWPYSWSPLFPAGYQMPLCHTPYWPFLSTTASNPKGKDLKDEHEAKLNETKKESVHQNCIVVPKILRFDDPEEAAKSSLWRTLGINSDSYSREGLFKALQAKGDENSEPAETFPALRANPAALARSRDFHEMS